MTTNKQTVKTARIGHGKRGPGRPKGSANKITREVRELVLAALDEAGGIDYLKRQANESPSAFMALVGKCLPTHLEADAHHTGSVMLNIGFGSGDANA